MIHEESLEVFQTIAAKQETVDPRTKLLEGEVRRGKNGASDMVRCIIKTFEETSLGES